MRREEKRTDSDCEQHGQQIPEPSEGDLGPHSYLNRVKLIILRYIYREKEIPVQLLVDFESDLYYVGVGGLLRYTMKTLYLMEM